VLKGVYGILPAPEPTLEGEAQIFAALPEIYGSYGEYPAAAEHIGFTTVLGVTCAYLRFFPLR
jgi:hypothetical protein